MRLTDAEFEALISRRGLPLPKDIPQPKEGTIVRQRRKVPNKTETRFETDFLKPWLHIGQIKAYEFEPVSLRFANGALYTPDWWTIAGDGKSTVFYEIKGGFIRDKAVTTIKAAASAFPHYKFVLCQYQKGEWTQQEIRA